jgi:hypothetical protein
VCNQFKATGWEKEEDIDEGYMDAEGVILIERNYGAYSRSAFVFCRHQFERLPPAVRLTFLVIYASGFLSLNEYS